MGLVSELRRRNVFRMAVLYAVAAWLVMQVAEVLIALAKLPDWIGQTTLILLAVGFPIALIFSWVYELTPEGISLEKDVAAAESITHVTGRRMDFIVISLLCAAVILFAYDKWWLRDEITVAPAVSNSIAVLPFVNMSADPEQEFFSDGISEDLLNLLAQIPELQVISRSSSFSFKGEDIAIPTVAEQLNVAHVLEGSVRKVGNRVRITAQLIEADSDSHLWSQSYDRELDDIFAVQDEIAGAISDALRMKLALVAGEALQPTAIRAANTDAYDAFLQGRELFRQRGEENVEDAVRHFKRSLRLDNSFAPAHAQLAIATLILIGYGESPVWGDATRIVNALLDRAQALEPDLAEAHGGRALLALLGDDPESTIDHARKALASNPNYSDAMTWLQLALQELGRYEEADELLKQVLVIDPLSFVGRWNYAEWLALNGRVAEAHEVADQLLEQDPFFHATTSLFYEGKIAEGLSWALKGGGGNNLVIYAFTLVGEFDEARRLKESQAYWIDAYEGRWDEAIRGAQGNMRLDPDDEGFIVDAAIILYLAGRIDEALPLYERLREFVPEGRPILRQGMRAYMPVVQTMRLALARRRAGDEDGAQAAAQIVRQEHAARRAAGRRNQEQELVEAMLAAFENDADGVIAALKSAMRRGLTFPWWVHDRIFEDLWGEPRFVALQQELDAILEVEHDKVLQLICFNNPTPDDWQPLPETCEGVEEKRRP
jgi:TolB-like protein/Flp pilus assembly protein TadD